MSFLKQIYSIVTTCAAWHEGCILRVSLSKHNGQTNGWWAFFTHTYKIDLHSVHSSWRWSFSLPQSCCNVNIPQTMLVCIFQHCSSWKYFNYTWIMHKMVWIMLLNIQCFHSTSINFQIPSSYLYGSYTSRNSFVITF